MTTGDECGIAGCAYDDDTSPNAYDAETLLSNMKDDDIYAREDSDSCVNIISKKQILYITSSPTLNSYPLEIIIKQDIQEDGLRVLNSGKSVGLDQDSEVPLVTIHGSEQEAPLNI